MILLGLLFLNLVACYVFKQIQKMQTNLQVRRLKLKPENQDVRDFVRKVREEVGCRDASHLKR